MKNLKPIFAFGLFLLFHWLPSFCFSQGTVENYMPFDPSNSQTRIPIEFDSYYFSGGHRFYAMRFSYHYSVPNDRHMMALSVPVVHTIFNDDFAGFENTTGIGDIRFTYIGVPYQAKKNSLALKKIALVLDVTTPTGSERLGRGVGSWVYKPSVLFTYQPDIAWYIFPEISFQFSTDDVYSQGSDATPDLAGLEDAERLQNISITLPTTYSLLEWDGWVGLSADYIHTYVEDTYFLFLRMQVGKMIGPRTSAALELTQFVAGQPRLQTVFKARLNFFLR